MLETNTYLEDEMKVKIKNKQLGATILEIMVSLFIMAIGLLGLASLQINAMKFEKGSSERAEASMAAYDISERIRANPSNALVDYLYQTEYNLSYKAAHTVPNTCDLSNCLPNQIAQNDRGNWLISLQRKLTGGTGFISVVAGAARPTLEVAILWNEQGLKTVDDYLSTGSKSTNWCTLFCD